MSQPYAHLKAVVFDWAGTMVDYGSLAPMGVFVETFRRFGVEISIDEARGPMGMAKRDHIKTLLNAPRIAKAWREKHDRHPGEADIDAIYEVFVPMNVAVAGDHADLIPGVAETVASLRGRGLKIGSTTGYTREIMANVLPKAKEQGYEPDNLVCAGETATGRPSALMMYRTFLDLGVWPAWGCVKVDDTEVGIAEGTSAGTWTIGVAVSGNVFGLDRAATEALGAEEFDTRRRIAAGRLFAAGAHYVIDSVAEIEPVLDIIEGRLARGERP
ncbi:MAG: phosphonoacetaldehyde hydrolase [Geminicoccaceae bacterium]